MSLLGFGRRHQDPTIHGIRLKVRAGTEPLPAPLAGAYVTTFSIAAEPRDAAGNGVRAILAMGYDVEEIVPEGLLMPLSGWGDYISQAWPEFRGELPAQSEIAARLADGGVIFSPFAGFEVS